MMRHRKEITMGCLEVAVGIQAIAEGDIFDGVVTIAGGSGEIVSATSESSC